MRILLIMDPGIPVPPPFYGGHERLVFMFAEDYIKNGHSVTLLAGPQSKCSGETITFGINDLLRSNWQKSKEILFIWYYLIKNRNKFDVIHNFGRLIYILSILNCSIKKVMTYGRPITGKWINLIHKLPHKNLILTACSNDCVMSGNTAGNWKTVYNAIDFKKYTLQPHFDPASPLIFLGRIEEVKGTHTAIKVAIETNHKLWIAGNIEPAHQSFFDTEIAPFIDNKNIFYLGPLNDEQKNEYLGKAKAILFPVEWDEPFGMVMVEAMACGTPAIGFSRGGVPEVIDEGMTGFNVKNKAEMSKTISLIGKIDRVRCRERAKERFDLPVITKDYLSIFENSF